LPGASKVVPGIKAARIGSRDWRMSRRSFDEVVLPHLDAAFNYARWLTRNEADAEDVVQDACVRAFRFFSSLRGDEARAWLLTIVRNTWYGRFPKDAGAPPTTVYDDTKDDRPEDGLSPEALLLQQQTVDRVRDAVEQLPIDFREVIILRELEGLSYKEIAAVMGVPIGTVMSRLARGRERLLMILASREDGRTYSVTPSGGHRDLS
jgi:RNA polymerase sigma factor (sigma-70 family)